MSDVELDRIADILPPPIPVSSADNLWQVFIFLIITILLSIYIYYYRSNKQQLKRLKKRYKNKEISQRQLAFNISKLLKSLHINSNESFHKTLEAARFSRNGINEDSMMELIQRVEKWI